MRDKRAAYVMAIVAVNHRNPNAMAIASVTRERQHTMAIDSGRPDPGA